MTGLFTPRYIQDGREMLKAARKMLHYKRDLLQPGEIAALEAQMEQLQMALKSRNREEAAAAGQQLDERFAGHFPVKKHAALRENCEVFLVAIVIAVGVRTYFIQPFTIPTGSMQPTLNGIIAYRTEAPSPNALTQALHFALYGRSYVDVTSKVDDTVISVRPVTKLRFFNFSVIQCANQQFTVHIPPDKLERDFGVKPGRSLAAGEVVARGYVNTGDHVFVDKMSYNFRPPHRGEVFVFNTLGIQTQENVANPGGPSQYYIKRLAGTPGDQLQIDSPNLYINGRIAEEPGFQRVMRAQDGYHGYSNPPSALYLTKPDASFHVPEKRYFALGDNSYNSSDSRYWGVVPEQNLMGHGLFVYWPFTSHWGLIK